MTRRTPRASSASGLRSSATMASSPGPSASPASRATCPRGGSMNSGRRPAGPPTGSASCWGARGTRTGGRVTDAGRGLAGRALVVTRPGEIGLADRTPPAAGPGETLVRPDLVGLCGTDLELIAGDIDPAYTRYPIALGHEWTGIVAGDSPLAGQRVVVEGVIPCWHCARCVRGETNLCENYDEIGFTRDGAAVALIAVPSALLHPIAAAVAARDAVLTEPSAVVYRALSRAAVSPGSRVLVIGDGTIALLAVYLVRLWSPAEVVLLGRRPAQAELAATAGATRFETSPDAAGAGY